MVSVLSADQAIADPPVRYNELSTSFVHWLTLSTILNASSSASGRCVRRMDHFCPWIGQEVGQLNHKVRCILALSGRCRRADQSPSPPLPVLPCVLFLVDVLHSVHPHRDSRLDRGS